MEIKKIYQEIIKTAKNESLDDTYLAHIFIMPSQDFDIKKDKLGKKGTEIHVGFYNKKTKRIFSYRTLDEIFEIIPEQELFKKEEEEVLKVDLDKLTIDIKEVLEIVNASVIKDFPETVSLKTILVLQNLITYGFVWNITVLRRDFKTLNYKIDAVNGRIKHISCDNIIDLNRSTNKKSNL